MSLITASTRKGKEKLKTKAKQNKGKVLVRTWGQFLDYFASIKPAQVNAFNIILILHE